MTKEQEDSKPVFGEYKREIYSLLENLDKRVCKLEDGWIDHDRKIIQLLTKAGVVGGIVSLVITIIGIIIGVVLHFT